MSELSALAALDDEQRAEYWASLALRNTPGLGARSVCRLLRYFGSAYAAVYAVARWKEAGISPLKGASLGGDKWRQEARPEWEDARDLEGEILLWTDPRYPVLLRELPDAPALLYAKGNPDLLLRPCLAVVGSRSCTQSGRQQSGELARELSACGICVVSGMARGIDRAAHEGALQEHGSSIAVLGSGVDVIYPKECTALYKKLGKDGLILSEFPPGTLPQGPLFPIRNRIISGLSLGTIVAEASMRSGSLITARIALEQNRHVFSLLPPDAVRDPAPAPISEGCSSLLNQGARAARNARDVLAEILPLLTMQQPRLTLSRPRPLAQEQQELAAPQPEIQSKPKISRKAKPIPVPAAIAEAAAEAEEKRRQQAAIRAEKKAESQPPRFPEKSVIKEDKQIGPHLSDFAPSSPEHAVLTLLLTHGSMDSDTMLAQLPSDRFNAGNLSAVLLMLEVAGAVRLTPGNIYEVSCHEN